MASASRLGPCSRSNTRYLFGTWQSVAAPGSKNARGVDHVERPVAQVILAFVLSFAEEVRRRFRESRFHCIRSTSSPYDPEAHLALKRATARVGYPEPDD